MGEEQDVMEGGAGCDGGRDRIWWWEGQDVIVGGAGCDGGRGRM